jgi:hypothetical protein
MKKSKRSLFREVNSGKKYGDEEEVNECENINIDSSVLERSLKDKDNHNNLF